MLESPASAMIYQVLMMELRIYVEMLETRLRGGHGKVDRVREVRSETYGPEQVATKRLGGKKPVNLGMK